MEIFNKINLVRSKVNEWKKEGLSVGLVPTMGALHIGHESLVQKARKECDRVVVSVFVNPIQFGPNEDYNKYPRQLDKDSAICHKNGVDLIFVPADEEMYPDIGVFTYVIPPEFFKDKLCGKTRKGHFDGVTTVVTKLFNIVQPDNAYFGQKDAQQLIIIRKMIRDLNIPVKVISCSIIRDNDGLACSSRNAYLSIEDHKKALSIHKVLFKAEELYNLGKRDKSGVLKEAQECLDKFIELEYLEAYDANTFEPVDELKHDILFAIAAKVGNVRLIDNIFV